MGKMFSPQQKIYVLATTGAMGDTVCTFPIIKTLIDRGHIEKLFVDSRYIDLYKLFFDNDLLVNMQEAMMIIPASQVTPDIPQHVIDPRTGEARFLNYPINPNIPVVETLQARPTSIHSHLVDCFSLTLCDVILKDSQKNMPLVDRKKLPPRIIKEDYIVIAYGATTEHRRMLPEVFNGLVKHATEQGYKVVLLGNENHELNCQGTLTKPSFEGINREGCIDLINATSVVEALGILYDATAVYGVDNGLLHLASLTDTYIVGGFTTVDPYYRIPFRHNEKGWHYCTVIPDTQCKFCQTDTFCTYGINFLRCNTTTKECMKSLTLDKWLEASPI